MLIKSAMETDLFALSHDWELRNLRLDEVLYSHRYCRRCGRSFVKTAADTRWRAVHVGIFQFLPLEDEINDRWVNEKCPGTRMLQDALDRTRQKRKTA
jgi:hypothetical protein